MKIEAGTDIVEISRIKESIEKYGNKFLEKVYTPNEVKYCEAKNINKYESYAGRFAAKEAIFKSISHNLDKEISWKDIEIINESNGKPLAKINLEVDKLEAISISISHSKENAIAYAIAVFKER